MTGPLADAYIATLDAQALMIAAHQAADAVRLDELHESAAKLRHAQNRLAELIAARRTSPAPGRPGGRETPPAPLAPQLPEHPHLA